MLFTLLNRVLVIYPPHCIRISIKIVAGWGCYEPLQPISVFQETCSTVSSLSYPHLHHAFRMLDVQSRGKLSFTILNGFKPNESIPGMLVINLN
ncbi:hypothetical protein VNO78_08084 [Psophocarpus tetragonolobus]|uniref:Uncharacterized protein n=1 Tax=Psophocarpus tetragonolobus TaxID=3891 RepID=A0AAN9T4F6_PSOTE